MLVTSLTLAATLAVVAEAQAPVLIVLNKSEASASFISISDGSTIAKLPVGEGPHG